MAIGVVINGVAYSIPSPGDTGWGTTLDAFLQAVCTGTLQPVGGSQPLTADIDLGSSFGPLAAYFKSKTATIAASGVFRMAKSDAVAWRNNANSADVSLGIGAQDQLTFAGVDVTSNPMAAYTATSSTSFPTGTTIMNFNLLDYDTHSAVVTGVNWQFVVPAGKAGKYKVSASVVVTGTLASGGTLGLYKNGTLIRVLWKSGASIPTGTTMGGTVDVRLVATDFIDVRFTNPGSTFGTSTGTGENSISIARLVA